MTLKGPYTRPYIKGQNLNFYLETRATPHNIHATLRNICLLHTAKNSAQIIGKLYWRVDDPLPISFLLLPREFFFVID